MLSRSETRLIDALKHRKSRAEEGRFLAEGVRVAEEALGSGIDLDFAATSPSLEDSERGRLLLAQLQKRGIVRAVSEAELNHLAATESPQGVVMVGRIPEATLSSLVVGNSDKLLVLDAVQDPGNFGTLVRTADALDVRAVLALPGTVDPWNPKSVRAAAGSSFHLPMIQVDVSEASIWLAEREFALYAADAKGLDVREVSFAARAALIVGNEGAGLSDAVRALSFTSVSIPIRGKAESLNVGVAAGILLYLLTEGLHA
jgi:RNA methyltransferase, TrmH family